MAGVHGPLTSRADCQPSASPASGETRSHNRTPLWQGGLLWWVGLALLSFMVAGAIGAGRIREFYFISDMLYLPTLVADLTRWHGQMRDWRLTPAPYLFPDLLF